MPSDCVGACACDCRRTHTTLREVEDHINKLEVENERLKQENAKLKAKLKKLGTDRDAMIDNLANQLKKLEE